MKANPRHPKISGERLLQFHGLTVYAKLKIPKQARVQLHIRQDDGYDYHVEQCLNYRRSLGILFATGTTRNNRGLIV
jgi:hypothetical protein